MIENTLAHYEITSQIGKGGMGEVYQAKDQKLGRDVAIKILPEEFAKDAARVARFQREAKLLASLNHPNIAAIHGLEEVNGTHFLVLELVEGNTLDDRIKAGSIPVEEALKLALQIAEALDAAHEKGVIHRDLKPANIKVTQDGKVKVLDFGLAKAFGGEQADLNLSNSPTLSQAATMQGVILGTAAYMSPEQAKGKKVDKRTDIWAFGVVMFEMLTGKPAFPGEEVSEILASVIKGDINLDLLPSNIHQRIYEVISRCLQKELRKRFADIADARYEIEQVLTDPSGLFMQPIASSKLQTKSRSIIPWVVAILGVVIAATAVWYLKSGPPPSPVIRFYQEVPKGQFVRSGETLTAISADGARIVYVSNGQLYLRELKDLDAIPIQETNEDPASPFFSPDGQWVGYYSFLDGQWKKVSISGGSPITLCDAPTPNGVVWTENKTILFAGLDGHSIMQVPDDGGTAESVIEAKEGEGVYGPQILPGGEWVLFTITSSDTGPKNWDKARIAVESLKTGERKVFRINGRDARYVPTGHIVYAQGNVLYANAFDVENRELTEGRFPIVKAIMRATQNVSGTAHYGFSDTGTLVHVAGDKGSVDPNTMIVWVDRDGTKEEPLIPEPKLYVNFKLSPDGKKVAFSEMDETQERSNIQIWDVERRRPQAITLGDSFNDSPIWTQDGKGIVFRSNRENREGIYWQAASGAGKAKFIGSMPNDVLRPFSILKDPQIIFVTSVFTTPTRIARLPMEGEQECVTLLNGFDPMISPDERWLAYASYDESGDRQIYVNPYPDIEGGLWPISTEGGDAPLWSPDPNRRELYYRSSDEVIAVEYEEKGSIFIPRSSETLFTENYLHNGPNQWDISPDGRHFLMMKQELSGVSGYTINIIQNWFKELKEKVPD